MGLFLGVLMLAAIAGGAVPCRALGAETTPTPGPAPACNGDCNGDHAVSIDELVQIVGLLLGSVPVGRCPNFVCAGGPPIAIDCLVGVVNNALVGCPAPTPVPPVLSLGLQVSEFADQQQTVIVAALRHLGGSMVSYVTGCTAQCDPLFLDPISFDVFGPSGDPVRVRCEDGGPLYCPEWPQAFAPGDSLTQTLTIDGVAWEWRGNQFPSCGTCRDEPLPPGRYSVVATFAFGIGEGYPDPRFELTESAQFDWPPTGSPPTPTPPPGSPLASDTPSVVVTGTATPTPTRPCPGTPGATCGPGSVFTCSDPPACRCGCFTLTPTPSPTRPCPGTYPHPTCGIDSRFVCSDPPVCSCRCVTLTPTPLPTPTASPSPGAGFRIDGCVDEFPNDCGQPGFVVVLAPLGLSALSPEFHFMNLPPGDYLLSVSPGCNPFGCWKSVPVTITDHDVFVHIALTPHATPTRVPLSPTGTVMASPTPDSLLAAIRAPWESACAPPPVSIGSYLYAYAVADGYRFACERSAGHGNTTELHRYPSTLDAAAAFASAGKEFDPLTFEDLPAASREVPFPPGLPSLGGKEVVVLWQLECWLASVRSYDDTHFSIAPNAVALSRAILTSAGDFLRADCAPTPSID